MSVQLAAHLIPPCAQYKPESFKNENEVRFLRVIPANRNTRYLKSSGVLDYALKEEDIEAIWLGPLSPPGIKTWLENKLIKIGWKHLKIKETKNPFLKA